MFIFRGQWVLVLIILAMVPVSVGCGSRKLSEEATPIQASDTSPSESPVNNAENP